MTSFLTKYPTVTNESLDRYRQVRKEVDDFLCFNDLKHDQEYIFRFDDDDTVWSLTTELTLHPLTDEEITKLPPLNKYRWLNRKDHLHVYTNLVGTNWGYTNEV